MTLKWKSQHDSDQIEFISWQNINLFCQTERINRWIASSNKTTSISIHLQEKNAIESHIRTTKCAKFELCSSMNYFGRCFCRAATRSEAQQHKFPNAGNKIILRFFHFQFFFLLVFLIFRINNINFFLRTKCWVGKVSKTSEWEREREKSVESSSRRIKMMRRTNERRSIFHATENSCFSLYESLNTMKQTKRTQTNTRESKQLCRLIWRLSSIVVAFRSTQFETLHEIMIKIFNKIKQFEGEGTNKSNDSMHRFDKSIKIYLMFYFVPSFLFFPFAVRRVAKLHWVMSNSFRSICRRFPFDFNLLLRRLCLLVSASTECEITEGN